MSDNEIGIKATWDTKDFVKGQEAYLRGVEEASRASANFNDTILKLARGEKELREFEKAHKYFDAMTDAEKDAIIASEELRLEQEKLAKELANTESITKRYDEAMKNAANTMTGKFAAGAISVGKNLTVGVTMPLVAAGAAGVKAFSDLEESINAANVTFGSSSKILMDYAKTAAESAGLSQRAFLQASVPIGASLQNVGMEASTAADWTVNLTARAADMASVFNTDVNDALDAIQSGLRGQSEPLLRYGVGLGDAAIKSYALASGIIKTEREMTNQEKTLARLGLLMEQTARVQGDFVNTSDGLANSTRIAKAQLENAAATLGEKLIPIATKAVGVGSGLVDMFNDLTPAGQDAAITIAAVAAGIGPALIGIGNLVKAYQSLDAAIKAASLSTKAFLVTAGAWIAIVASVVAVGIVATDTYKKLEKAADEMQSTFTDSMLAMAEAGATQNEILENYVKSQREATKAINEMGVAAKLLTLMTKDQIKNYSGLNQALAEAGGSYDNYRDAMIQAAIANGDLNEEFVRTRGHLPGFRGQIDGTLLRLGAYTSEQYNAIIAAKELQNQLRETALATELVTEKTGGMERQSRGASMAQEYQAHIMKEAVAASIALGNAASTLTIAMSEQVTEAKVQFAVQGKLKSIYESQENSLESLAEEHAKLLEKKEKLLRQGYSPEGKAITEVNEALDENTKKQQEVQQATEDATKALIYQTAIAGLDGDAGAQLALARALGLVSEADYDLIKATEAINESYKKTNDLEGYTKAMSALYEAALDGKVTAEELKKILDELDGKVSNAEVNVHTNYTSSGGGAGGGKGGGAGGGSGGPELRASGGPVEANQPYIVGEEGPEFFVPSSAGEIINAAMTKGIMDQRGRKGSAGDVPNPFATFTDVDFSIFDTMKRNIQDAINLMVDAGDIGKEEANLLYQSMVRELQSELAGDEPLTDEFIDNMTKGFGNMSKVMAEITKQQNKLAEEDQKVADAEKALADARASGQGVDEAKAALDIAKEQRKESNDKLDLLKRQLEALKQQKDLDNEIQKAAEEARQEAERAAEEARKTAQKNFSDAERRLETAQAEMKRIADIEKRMAEDAEIAKAQSAVANAKKAIDEISKTENQANVKKNAAVAEYNKLLRQGASPEVLAQQKAAIEAAQSEIDAAKESKVLAQEKLAAEEEALDATRSRIEEGRKEQELDDFKAAKEAAIAQLEEATIEYNRTLSELRRLTSPDMDFIQSSAIVGELTDTISKILGGGQADRSVSTMSSTTLNMNMTNQVNGAMDLAVIENIIRRTIKQEFR
jgi:hypothetical protein